MEIIDLKVVYIFYLISHHTINRASTPNPFAKHSKTIQVLLN